MDWPLCARIAATVHAIGSISYEIVVDSLLLTPIARFVGDLPLTRTVFVITVHLPL